MELVSEGREIATPSLNRTGPSVSPHELEKDPAVPKVEEHLLFERFMCWWNQLRRTGQKLVEPERHFTFFKLSDAFEQNECPICYLCSKARDLFLSNLWYENVNDVGLRNHLHRSLGFCADATRTSIAIGDDLGASIVYRSLCADVAGQLHDLKDVVPSEQCPVAEHVATMNQNYVHALAAHYVAKDVQELHEKGAGLCLQHIHETLQVLADPKLRKAFLAVEEAKFRRLAEELNMFVGKSDYLNKRPFGAERNAWIRAMRKFNRDEHPNH